VVVVQIYVGMLRQFTLHTTDGTIYSWGLRASFLSSRTAAVAGCAVVCPHRNPN